MFSTDNCKIDMKNSIESFENELKNIRTGRVSPDILKNIIIDLENKYKMKSTVFHWSPAEKRFYNNSIIRYDHRFNKINWFDFYMFFKGCSGLFVSYVFLICWFLSFFMAIRFIHVFDMLVSRVFFRGISLLHVFVVVVIVVTK